MEKGLHLFHLSPTAALTTIFYVHCIKIYILRRNCYQMSKKSLICVFFLIATYYLIDYQTKGNNGYYQCGNESCYLVDCFLFVRDYNYDFNDFNSLFQMTGSYRQLTWQSVIKQEFSQPGQYTLTLEVFNSVSSIFYTQSVDVYGRYFLEFLRITVAF